MRTVHRLEEATSTNDVARELAAGGAPSGTTVIAAAQTAGRGRHGASWHSPPGAGLYLSIVHRTRLTATDLGALTLDAAVACATALEDLAGVRPQLKWPNDLWLDGRKLGGILTELHTNLSGDGSPVLIVGVGINVNLPLDSLPSELEKIATSLLIATGRDHDVDTLALLVARRLAEKLAGFEATGQPDMAAYEARFPFAGWRVDAGPRGRGTIRRVLSDGSLDVSFDGRDDTQPVRSGEVTLLGPPAGGA